MFLRHRTTAGTTRRATRSTRSSQRRLRGESAYRTPAERNDLYEIIARHSPQADTKSLLRLLG